jgi:ubiquinone/menaquinone biosynthesis C-methylase UbiE
MRGNSEILTVTRPRAAAGPAYDKMSLWYDLISGPSERRYRNAGVIMLAPKDGENILEVGCGTGHSVLSIAKAIGEKGKVTAFDLSVKMLEKTRKRLLKTGFTDRAEIVQGDAFELPFQDAMFDAVFMSFTLELFDTGDIPVVLTQCLKVLKPGGRLIIVAMSKGERQGMMIRLYEWLHTRFPYMVDCRPIKAAQSITDAGFRVEVVRKMSLAGIPVEIIEAFKK